MENVSLRKTHIIISEKNFVTAIAGNLYAQAPNKNPRKADIIMEKTKEKFRKAATNNNEFYLLSIPKDELYDFIKDTLSSIPEFCETNLSQNEYDAGIDVDDERRPKYSFVTAYDKLTSESWRNDFIDLDAFYRNAYRLLLTLMQEDRDCFMCDHNTDNKNTEECKTCIRNNNLTDNYLGNREPRGKYTYACADDCFRSRYICCMECDEADTCLERCDGNPDICGKGIKKVKR